MSDALKAMVQDIINDRRDQARVTVHDYFVSSVKKLVAGEAPASTEELPDEDND